MPNVYLVGPMGSGKTTIGQRVARHLGLAFVDCDQELERRTGASVNLIFDIEGEAGFRERERRMLRELTRRRDIVLATGGGVVLDPKNRDLLAHTGLVVYLRTSVRQQLSRLRRDKSRPLLQSGDREEKLARLASERNPLYESLADIEFPAQGGGVDRTARQLSERIRAHWKQHDASQSGSGRANDG